MALLIKYQFLYGILTFKTHEAKGSGSLLQLQLGRKLRQMYEDQRSSCVRHLTLIHDFQVL